MTENKFDKMMHSYCNRETEQFEFKEKKSTLKYTSVLAAALVLAILATVLIIPNNKVENSFTLTVSAAESENEEALHRVVVNDELYYVSATESEIENSLNDIVTYDEAYGVENLYTRPLLRVKGENIEKVRTYSDKGNIAIAYCAKYYNITDKYHYENFPPLDDIPDPLIVIPCVKNSKGEFVEANIDTRQARDEIGYSCVEIVDINRNSDEKYIDVSCYPIDENGKALMPEDFASECNDKVTVEVTYLNGEVQTKYANITFEDGNMVVDIIS